MNAPLVDAEGGNAALQSASVPFARVVRELERTAKVHGAMRPWRSPSYRLAEPDQALAHCLVRSTRDQESRWLHIKHDSARGLFSPCP